MDSLGRDHVASSNWGCTKARDRYLLYRTPNGNVPA